MAAQCQCASSKGSSTRALSHQDQVRQARHTRVACYAAQDRSTQHEMVNRRSALLMGGGAVCLTLINRPAFADALDSQVQIQPATETSPNTIEPTAAPISEAFQDDEYSYVPPTGFEFVDIPIPRTERGPAPERSPIRSRFVAAAGNTPSGPTASLSVVARSAQSVTFTLLQVTDVSAFGSPEEAAKLLVPRGSVVLRTASETVTIPPKETPLGLLEVPPKSYYYYEFISKQGEHILMSVAAARGKVFVCGGAAPKDQWPVYATALTDAVKSFRLK